MSDLEDFVSTDCPACGRKKHPFHSFCGKCYYSLSPAMRGALWQRMGEGYERAYGQALEYLKGRAKLSRGAV